jgi:hypothetical protein
MSKSSWIDFKKDSQLVAKPFLYVYDKSLGKGLFFDGDIPRNILLGGQSYPQFYYPVVQPPYHTLRKKRFYD